MEFAGCGHEALNNMFRLFEYGDSSFWPNIQEDKDHLPLPGPPHIDTFGSAEVVLADGVTKAPDQSLLDGTPGRPARLKGWPTVAFEVAWSQTSKNLAEVCGRWVAASIGKVNLAIGIDIIVREKKDNTKGEDEDREDGKGREASAKGEDGGEKKRKEKKVKQNNSKELAQLWISLWELVDAEPLSHSPPASEPVNELIRSDGYQENPLVLDDFPPATKFTCVSPFENFPEQIAAIGEDVFQSLPEPPLFVRYHAAVTQCIQVPFFRFLFSNPTQIAFHPGCSTTKAGPARQD